MSKYSLPKKNPVVSEENAHAQIMMLVERYGIDVDTMPEEKKEAVEQALDHLSASIVKGSISIEEVDGEVKVTQYLQHKSADGNIDKLVFREMRGRDHVKMSEKNNDNQYKKMQALLAAMCETPNGHHAIGMLRASDASTAEWLSTLFL